MTEDYNLFKRLIEKFVSKSKKDAALRIHEHAIIANTIRLTLKCPNLAKEYLEKEFPIAVQDN